MTLAHFGFRVKGFVGWGGGGGVRGLGLGV